MRPGRAPAVSLLLVSLLAPLGPTPAERLEVYQPRHRAATELAPLVSGILAPGGVALPDAPSGQLILRGDSPAVEQALELLQRLDIPLAVYRVESTITTLRELLRAGFEVEGWVEAGEIRVGTVAAPAEGLRVRTRSSLSEGETRFQGVLTVLEGTPGEIWTGTTYPERIRTLNEEAGRLRVYETTTLVPVRTGFRVLPRALQDGRVELEIAPVSAEEDADGTVVRAGVATQVSARPGDLVVVGSVQRRDKRISIDPFATLDYREGASDTVLAVQVESLPNTP